MLRNYVICHLERQFYIGIGRRQLSNFAPLPYFQKVGTDKSIPTLGSSGHQVDSGGATVYVIIDLRSHALNLHYADDVGRAPRHDC